MYKPRRVNIDGVVPACTLGASSQKCDIGAPASPLFLMNLEEKLRLSLDDVLCTSGYIFEIIGNNRKQSNLLTGTNNLLITPAVTNSLARSLAKFDEVLDDTISKFNDTRWCVEQIVENKQRQKEQKAREEEERKRLDDEKRKEDERKQEEKVKQEKQRQEDERRLRESQIEVGGGRNVGGTESQGVSPVFDFNFNELPEEPSNENKAQDIPDPADILQSIQYGEGQKKDAMDLDMNNILGNDELLLGGLNMDFLDPGLDQPQQDANDDDFDVDSFLNQLGGGA